TLCICCFTLRFGGLVVLRGAVGRQQAKRLRMRSTGGFRCCADGVCVYHLALVDAPQFWRWMQTNSRSGAAAKSIGRTCG
ncbi:MAG: hypothetical protein K2P04_03800, partial [Oscillospiraceae bacterium]|nr:hypothetical protein [Oscillospiraceae bacterium]